MILGKCVTNQLFLFINGIKIGRASEVVLLGISVADQLTFKIHIEYTCRIAKYKLRTLERIKNYLKLMSILHYSWSADLLKSFSQLIVSIFIFLSQ